jgi:phosphate-selective porin OprO/OprP
MVLRFARFQGFSLVLASAVLSTGPTAQAQPATVPAQVGEPEAPAPVSEPVPPAAAAPEPAPPAPVLGLPPAPLPSAGEAPPPGEDTLRNPRPNEQPPAKFNQGSKFQLESADGQHKLEFHALLDVDGRWFLTDKGGVNTWLVRRARPSLDGKLFRYFDFTLQPDFAGSKLQLLDAYGNLHFWSEVQLRFGKMKPPVGLERLQSSRDTLFPETALTTQLVPNRDVGAELHGNIGNGTLEWALGLFNGAPDYQVGEQDANDSKDVEGRLFFQPFIPTNVGALRGLGLGIAGTVGNEQGAPVQYQSAGQTAFFTYASNSVQLGKRTLVSPQAYYYAGPFGAMFELVRANEHWVTPTTSANIGLTSWQLSAGVAVGGDETWRGVQVKQPVDFKKGTFGAFELGARYASLRVGDLAFERGFASRNSSAQLATEWGVVASWHFATWNHLRLAYENTSFRGGAPNGKDKRTESMLDTRFQVAF